MPIDEDEEAGRTHLVAYRLLADSAERTQDRRQAVNSFFITVNLAIAASYTFLLHARPHGALLWVTAGVGFLVCVLWFATLWYYRALLAAKFQILADFEAGRGVVGYQREWEMFSARHPFGLRGLSLAFIEMLFAAGSALAHLSAGYFLQNLHLVSL